MLTSNIANYGRQTAMLCGLTLLGGLACSVEDEATKPRQAEQEGLPRSNSWGDFSMTRHDRTSDDVIRRATLIAETVLQDAELPSASTFDPAVVEEWAQAAANDPYREGALRFELDDHDVLIRYRPASDRLTVSTVDESQPTAGTLAEPGAGSTPDEAAKIAQGCLSALEDKGVVGRGEFSSDHSYASSRPTYVEASGGASIDRYSFVYHPDLDGLPLTSAEVIISVNADSGRCQRITVSGQVLLERTGDAIVELNDEAEAARRIQAKVAAAAPAPLADVHVDGHFGYYLPLTSRSARVSPLFVATYATQTGTPEQPILSRSRLVGLPLVDTEAADLIDLLGPDW